MDVYLQRSEIVRDVFELGPPPTVQEAKDSKQSKQAKVRKKRNIRCISMSICQVGKCRRCPPAIEGGQTKKTFPESNWPFKLSPQSHLERMSDPFYTRLLLFFPAPAPASWP